MTKLILIGSCCGLGALLRYAFSFANHGTGLPLGTLLANLTAAFLIGFFWNKVADQELYAILSAGFLGGLGTYSTLNDDLIQLLKKPKVLLIYIGLTYGLGVFLVWLGMVM